MVKAKAIDPIHIQRVVFDAEHDPEAWNCMHKDDSKDAKDKEALLRNAHLSFIMNDLFQLVFRFKCFEQLK